MRILLVSILALHITLFSAGCGEVTYPKETLRESIIELCKEEYDIEVDVNIIGETLAIFLPLPSLLDVSLGLSDHAQDKIQNVLLGASRVTLSTDARIKFYCVIAQDVRLPEIQMIIIKYVDDIKRAFYNDISRGEYFKRTIIDINENPQSKKEQAITGVFSKMQLDEDMREKVLDDFFRSPPSSMEGIGYWNGKFYIKDITIEEFLAQQMANRIKTEFREEESLKKYVIKSITGKFMVEKGVKIFAVDFNEETFLFIYDPIEKTAIREEIFKNMFEEISDVIYAYKFENFNLIKAVEANTDTKLFVSREDLYLFKQRKLPIDTILGAIQ
ncbi:MAG: hypothetical protein ABID09_01660 [Candidatus Omnitrophota bacterium]